MRPGAPPQQPGARPMQPAGQARPLVPGARPGMMPQGAQPGVRPMQPRPVMTAAGVRPPMPVAGMRPAAAGVPPQGMRTAQPMAAPGQAAGPAQVRPGFVGAPMARAPSPVRLPTAGPHQAIPGARSLSPAGVRPAGAPGSPMLARPAVPGQVLPQRPVPGAVPLQRVPIGTQPGAPMARPAAAPLVRQPAGVAAPAMRPAAGMPTSTVPRPAAAPMMMRPAAGAPAFRPAASPGAPPTAAGPGMRPAAAAPAARPAAPVTRPAVASPVTRPAVASPVTRPAVASPVVRPAAASPMVRPAAASPMVRPAAAAPVVRPAAAAAPVVRPAAAAAPRPAGVPPPASAPGRGFPVASAPTPAPPAPAPVPAAPAAQPPAGPGGDARPVSTGELNMDDITETFRQVFNGQPPETSKRADPGTDGRPCKVLVNMYPVTLPRGNVFHYDVEIFSAARKGAEGATPVPTQKRARCASTLVNRKVIDAFSKCYQSELGNCILAFDGRKNIYTRRLLPNAEHIFNNVEAEVNGEKSSFVVCITYVATVSFDALHDMYDRGLKGSSQFQDAIQVADVILRTGPTLAFVPVGRSFFIDINLNGNREAWFGFYSSIRLGSWKPLVNIDMSATTFYVAAPLIDYAVKTLKKTNKTELRSGLNDRERALLTREIRTLRVTVSHLDSKRQYRIEGLRQIPASQETFEWDGTTISIVDYFAQKYNYTLQFPNLPCIFTGRGGISFPIELCNVVKGQHCRKKLNETQTTMMIRQTALAPKDRFERIQNWTQQLKSSSTQICQEFEMSFETKPLEVEARILQAPAITCGEKKKQLPKDGVWPCSTFLKPANIEKWVLAVLGRVAKEKLKLVVDLFQSEGGKLGMKIAPPQLIHNYGFQPGARQVLEDVKNKHPDVEMTVIVLDPRSDYGALKAEAETTDLCLRTQCVKDRNVETKFNGMFATNLLQKINTKMGGRNNGVLCPNTPDTLKKPYMAIGVDVNHPGPGESTPSIAAFVASMDSVPSQYYACTSVQLNRKGSRSEYVVETKSMFLECLTEFERRNKNLPAHIFIFRDGVADAQFDAVRVYELGAIRQACLERRPDYTPGMTFIVVQKRHHVRFMPAPGYTGSGKAGNIHPGTIVDSKIINPAIFDFYLCSHHGLQGTSRAAHYHVVHDDVHHSQNDIYKICYNLCHTYSRCTRAVSIPAPAYYAHLAAFRAKEHIKGRAPHNAAYAESNAESVRSSSSSEPDLDKFQAAQKVCNQMRGSMYFV
ncbi:protein argonaute-2 [Galendromus occidentalis]|uniref:Protein argonaute-2 n=1 Tax=Galendromus occidentalis TaxID=34638 RepID=A0AAJ7WHV3_9ACAR|nr:protein argonaute-2 [Galendromus occidentalis]